MLLCRPNIEDIDICRRYAHMLDTFNPKKDRSSAYLHCESASSSIENAGIAYQSPSLLAAGASAKEIAWLNTLSNLIFAVLLVKMPSLIKHGESLKKAAVILEIISALGWLPLIIVPILFRYISPSLLILIWVVNLVPGFIVGPLRDKWLSDMIPARRLSHYLSVRAIISAGTYISSFFVMGYFLDHINDGVFSGFSIIFSVGFLVSVASVVFYLSAKVPVAIGEQPQSEVGFMAFIREARQNELGTLIIFSAMIIFSASICGAFFSVYMLKHLHFSYLTYTLVLSVEYVSRMVISYFGGRWVDNAGAIKVLRFASSMIPLIPILWVFSSNIGYLIGIQVLTGVAWATYDLCIQSYLFKATPSSKRLHYIIYHRSIVTLAAATGPLLGALLLNVNFPFFSNPLLPIFLISGAMRFLVVVVILPRLKGAAVDLGELESGAVDFAGNFFSGKTPNMYPLYRTLDRKREPAIIKFSPTKPERKPGSFYHHEQWSLVLSASTRCTQNVRQDLRYHGDPRLPISTLRLTKAEVKPKIARLKNNPLYTRHSDSKSAITFNQRLRTLENVGSRS